MNAVSIRLRRPDDDEQIVSMRNRIYPEFPPLTVNRHRHWIEREAKDERSVVERYVAEAGGAAVGYAVLEWDYHVKSDGVYWIDLLVDKEHWGEGIGRRLYAFLLERLQALGARRLYAFVREDMPSAEAFAARRGFVPTGHMDRESRLDVRVADLDGYEGLLERLAETGIRITSMAEYQPNEDFLHALHEMEWRAVQDVPQSEELDDEPAPYELWREEMLHGPERPQDAFFLALDGERPVGLARLSDRPPAAFNGFTGVDRGYRGRGIARALKLKTVQWCRENGRDYIYTGNDVHNTRMLAINIRLGYQPLPSSREIVKELEAG